MYPEQRVRWSRFGTAASPIATGVCAPAMPCRKMTNKARVKAARLTAARVEAIREIWPRQSLKAWTEASHRRECRNSRENAETAVGRASQSSVTAEHIQDSRIRPGKPRLGRSRLGQFRLRRTTDNKYALDSTTHPEKTTDLQETYSGGFLNSYGIIPTAWLRPQRDNSPAKI
jgi:hypothetical protein